MFLQAWWEPILAPLLGALGTALTGLLSILLFRVIAWIKGKSKNERFNEAVERVAEVVDAAVKMMNQKFVDQMRKDGKFDKEAQKKAFDEVFEIVKHMLTDEIKDVLLGTFGDIEEYLKLIIEQTVANLKK